MNQARRKKVSKEMKQAGRQAGRKASRGKGLIIRGNRENREITSRKSRQRKGQR